MPLHLVTGPANAAKAGVVLDRYRQLLDRGPLLVVPTFADVERYRRELATTGTVFGVSVMRFAWLVEEMGRRGGRRSRPVSKLVRERVAAAAIAAVELDRLAATAATPGFGDALVRFVDELGQLRVDPARFYAAVRAWAGDDTGRKQYGEEVAALFGAYRRTLERLRRVDEPMAAAAAVEGLRVEPERWCRAPVLFYGFDDLTRPQMEAIETLAGPCEAEVWFSLTYEAGRHATAARATTYQELLALGSVASETTLEPRDDHYAATSRATLGAIERGLAEQHAPVAAGPDGVRLLEGGGERAEAELVAAQVARLIRDGVPAEEIAVVHRGLREAAPLLDAVFRGYEVPVALTRIIPAGHTGLGRGVIALLRCALAEGSADDLLAWLRTPGLLDRRALTDRLEARARRDGIRDADELRRVWEQEHWPLDALDRLREAHGRGPRTLCERLASEVQNLLAAPFRGRAAILDGPELADARAAAALRTALRELGGLDPALVPAPAELARLLEGLDVRIGNPPGPGRVTVADPLALRARRVRALFAMGMNEGVFPKAGRPEPFFSDDERRALNTASGLRLRAHEDALEAERYLLYATVSRPTELLVLSWHAGDDDGRPKVRSLFVDDVTDVLACDLTVQRRPLGAVGWPADVAPTGREAARHAAALAPPVAAPHIAPLDDPAVLGALAQRHTWSASAIETWGACPVKWFVERLLKPEPLVPDPEPMLRGDLAHRVLQQTIGGLQGALTESNLQEARTRLHAALEEQAGVRRISVNPERLRAHLRRLEVDLLAYLEGAARTSTEFVPAAFELRFGGLGDGHLPALELDGGALRLQGTIDRIDRRGDEAIVIDYKGKSGAARGERWLADRKLQVGLYMLAVRHVLGLEPVGGFYQPVGAEDPRARGAIRTEADPGAVVVRSDRMDAAVLEEILAGCARAAREAVDAIRAGSIAPTPDSCGFNGSGCEYPSICRCVSA